MTHLVLLPTPPGVTVDTIQKSLEGKVTKKMSEVPQTVVVDDGEEIIRCVDGKHLWTGIVIISSGNLSLGRITNIVTSTLSTVLWVTIIES